MSQDTGYVQRMWVHGQGGIRDLVVTGEEGAFEVSIESNYPTTVPVNRSGRGDTRENAVLDALVASTGKDNYRVETREVPFYADVTQIEAKVTVSNGVRRVQGIAKHQDPAQAIGNAYMGAVHMLTTPPLNPRLDYV